MSASSLRDMYTPAVDSWSFVPPQTNSSSPPSTLPSAPSTSYQWSTRPPPNSIFELSPALSLNQPQGLDVRLLLKTLVASAFLQYTSTALAMPLEVGKLLLQVQWVPRDLSLLEGHRPTEDELEDDGEVRISPLPSRPCVYFTTVERLVHRPGRLFHRPCKPIANQVSKNARFG